MSALTVSDYVSDALERGQPRLSGIDLFGCAAFSPAGTVASNPQYSVAAAPTPIVPTTAGAYMLANGTHGP